jgi:RHS repeat-associated protein
MFRKPRNRRLRRIGFRRFVIEQFEPRLLLNSDWHNPARPTDVNNDLDISPLDALLVINKLNSRSAGILPTRTNLLSNYYDTNGDTVFSPIDALLVINDLNHRPAKNRTVQRIEGEAEVAPAGFISVPLTTLPGHNGQLVSLSTSLNIGREEFNEMGLFVVDGPDGSVNGILPTSPDYGAAVFQSSQRQVLYSRADILRTARTATFPSGAFLRTYVLQSSTTNGDPASHLRVRETGTSRMQIGWEEVASIIGWQQVGDRGYDDAIVDVVVGTPFDGNAEPVITAIPNQSIDEQTPLVIQPIVMDADLPDDALVFTFDAAPAGATIDLTTGAVRWTPTESQGPGNFEFILRATDRAGAFDTESLFVTVLEVNRPPVLQAIGDIQVTAGQTVAFAAIATDPDLPANQLTYTLRPGSPSEAAIDRVTGQFRWTVPTNTAIGQYPVIVRVTDSGAPSLFDDKTFNIVVVRPVDDNDPPVIADISNQSFAELTSFAIQPVVTDPDLPADVLTFTIDLAPTGASIDPNTGRFSWTPAESQGPGNYEVILRATDRAGAFDTEAFTLTVLEANLAPVLPTISDKSIAELSKLEFAITATDGDLPSNSLTYSLYSAPNGASIDSQTGLFSWTPSESQGPGSFSILVRVDDGQGGIDTEEFSTAVTEVNQPPVLNTIADQRLDATDPLILIASATDPDLPANTLSFSLGTGTPSGMTIDAATGRFSWTPDSSFSGQSIPVTVTVTDNGAPSLSSSQLFNIQVDFCAFDSSLTGWTVFQSGGTALSQGTVTSQSCSAVIAEGDSFVVGLEKSIVVPATPSALRFTFSPPQFDESDTDFINDAFELSLVDTNGKTLVFPYAVNRNAFFNVSEGTSPLSAPGVVVNGDTVTVDISMIAPGTAVKVILRLINNDDDTTSKVVVSDVDLIVSNQPAAPPPGLTNESPSAIRGALIDPALLNDISGSFVGEYARTSFNEDLDVLDVEIGVRNAGQFLAQVPLYVGVRNISDPTIRVSNAVAQTTDGVPLFDFTLLVPNGQLPPSGITGKTNLEFFNPRRIQFEYELVFYGQLNRSPSITSEPHTEAIVNRSYRYNVTAIDLDADPITFSLITAPAGMVIDATYGAITWTPTLADIGTKSITVRAEDSRGGFGEQRYALSVITPPPNRPPVFTSVPTTTAFVNPATQEVVITFDDRGFEGNGGFVPGKSFQDFGVIFETDGRDSIYFNRDKFEGGLATSPPYAIVFGNVPPNPAPITLRATFVEAGTAKAATVLSVSGTVGDRSEESETITMRAFAADGRLLDTRTFITARTSSDPDAPGQALPSFETLSISAPGIAYIELSSTNVVMLDDFKFVRSVTPYPYVYDADAIDADSDTLTYTLASAPSGMFIHSMTGRIDWAPRAAQVGLHEVTISVADGHGGVADQQFTVQVLSDPANHPPVIVTEPPTIAIDGRNFQYDVNAIDADADHLTYSLTHGPDSMTVDKDSGLISWNIPPENPVFHFAHSFGSNGRDDGRGVATDRLGNVYLTGFVSGPVDLDPGSGVLLVSPAGPVTAYVAKFSPTGTLLWVKSPQGTGQSGSNAITVDTEGNIIVTGQYRGTVDFDPGSGQTLMTDPGNGAAFVWKLDANGNMLWVRGTQGTPVRLAGEGVEVDGQGNIVWMGEFYGTIDVDPGAGTHNLTGMNRAPNDGVGFQIDNFLVKLTADGDFVWGRQLGDTRGFLESETSRQMAMTDSDDVILIGRFQFTMDFDPGPLSHVVSSSNASEDIFVLKLNPAGEFVWVKTIGSIGPDRGTGVDVDSDGNVVLAGIYGAAIDIDPGEGIATLTHTNPNATNLGYNKALVKLDSNGNFLWGHKFESLSYGVQFDEHGDIFAQGAFQGSMDLDPGAGEFRLDGGQGRNYTVKLNATGQFMWAYATGGFNFVADCQGHVYSTGYYTGTVDFDPGETVQSHTSLGNSIDTYLTMTSTAPTCADVTVRVEDGRGGLDTQSFAIDVLGNRPPEIVSLPVTDASAGTQYNYDVEAIDPDSDTLAYSLATAPTGMTIDASTGRIAWNVPQTNLEFGFALKIGAEGQDGADPPVIAVAASGYVYVTGTFSSTVDFDPGPNAVNLTSAGGEDMYVAKYSPVGNFVWARRLGSGAGVERGHGIAVDPDENVYATGILNGDFGGAGNVVVAKLDSAGSFLWTRQLIGGSSDSSGVVIDGVGNAIVSGFFSGNVDFDPGAGSFNLTSVSSNESFLWKLNNAGQFVWAKPMGGQRGTDRASGLALDIHGNIFHTGSFSGTRDFDSGPSTFTLSSAGEQDAYMTRLTADGNFEWAVRLGGNLTDHGIGIEVDANGSAIVTGDFSGSGDFDPGPGVFTLQSAGDTDIFLVKLSATGSLEWARSFGGPGVERPEAIVTDCAGNLYISGRFSQTADFDSGSAVAPLQSQGLTDAFIAKLSANGEYMLAVGFGGRGFDAAAMMVATDRGDVFVGGLFEQTVDFDPGPGVVNLTEFGARDNFLLKLIQLAPCHDVTVRVEDGRGGIDTQNFTIDVLGNRPPEIVSAPVTDAFAGTAYSYDVEAIDPDNDTLAYSLATKPNGMTIDPTTGVVSWLPITEAQFGYAVRVESGLGLAVATDEAGNVVTTGGKSGDIFVAKYNDQGAQLWANIIVGPATNDAGQDVAVDALGNIYVTGHFRGTLDFDSGPGIFELSSNGFEQAFVLKLDPNGRFVWATVLNNQEVPGHSDGEGIALDSSGNVYVSGDHANGALGFIAKLDNSGALMWERRAATNSLSSMAAVRVDEQGFVYGVGSFSGTTDFDPGPGVANLTSAGSIDSVVWQLDGDGNFVWAKRIGGNAADALYDLEIDSVGNVVLTGLFNETVDFDPGSSQATLTANSQNSSFLLKLDSNGGFVWAKLTGGTTANIAFYFTPNLAVDKFDNIYVSGGFNGSVDTDPGSGVHTVTSRGDLDIFITKLNASGSFSWTAAFGGTKQEVGYDIAVDGFGRIYTTGLFNDTVDFDPGVGEFELSSPNGLISSLFLMQLTPSVSIGVRVEDGRGGFDTQSFTIDVNSTAPGEIRGTKFNDLDGDSSKLFDSTPNNVEPWERGNQLLVDRARHPHVIQLPSGQLRMYYTEETTGGSASAIFSAISTDNGNTWIKEGVRLLDGARYIYEPNVVKLRDGRYRMYYTAQNTFDSRWDIFSAISDDGMSWSKEAGVRIPRTFGGTHVGSPEVTTLPDGSWRMYFSGSTDFATQAGSMLSAVSTDGLIWTKEAGVRIPATSWNENVFAFSYRRLSDGRHRMYFTSLGSDDPWWEIYSAVSDDGINWTKEPGIRVDGEGSRSVAAPSLLSLSCDAFQMYFLVQDDTSGFNPVIESAINFEDSGLAGWTIYLDQNQNALLDAGERSTVSNSLGNYSFPNLAEGTNTVAEVQRPGWTSTFPLNQAHSVNVVSGQVVECIDFGNHQTSVVIPNRNPQFNSSASSIALQGELYRYNARATDPDNDPLNYDLVVKPTGMAVHAETGAVVWVPAADQVGEHDVTLRVQDGRGGVALQSFVITVSMANSTPVITSRPKGPAVVGLPYEYRVTAQDADGDPIVFSLGEHPTGMTIDAASGVVSWTPAANQVGSPHVEVTASDNRGAATTQSFDLPTVATATNRTPNITSTPRGSIRLGSQYLYAVVADDPDGDPLVYSLPLSPTGMTIDPRTGLVTWTPTASQMGANAVEVKVDDGRGAAVIQSFTVTVQNQSVNRPPNITSNPPAGATVGRSVAYDVVAIDPDGDPLAFSLDVFPAGMSINQSAGTIRWTPTADQLGARSVVVRVIDGQGGFATQSFTITVRAVNTPPNVTSTPPTFASIGNQYSYAVRATDIDGDSLTFAPITMPTGMTIDSPSGLIRWTPAANQLGSLSVAFRVDDGQGGAATQFYTLVVTATAANNPPVITSNPNFVATVDLSYQYNVTATDADGDTLTYQLQNPPAGMAINATTGVVTWTPTAAQLGTHTITVAAIDGQAGGTQTYTLRVATTNRHPTITSQPPPGVVAGLVYRYDVRASDPDGDPITYTLDTAPAGMTIDNLGRISWQTTRVNVGTHRVAVSVEDDRGLLVTQTFDMVVLADRKTPLVNLIVRPGNRVAINSVVTFVVTATDNVGVNSIGLTINGNPVALDAAGRVSFIATPVGLYDIVASATDDAGNTGLASTQILVFDNSDQVPPVVEVTSPLDNAIVSAPIDVVGTVTDANLAFYTLSVAPVGSDTFTELVRRTTSVTAGVLGKFDPTGLANDSYILRLEATDTGGNISYVDTLVQVAGDLKIGNFTLSFTDMTVPVSGIPITVSRTYDTLQANQQDDFGFGWRLEFRDMNLRTSVPSSGAEEYGSFTPYNDGARVYVTAPGGRREGFTFRPRLVSGFGALVGFYNPVFVPDRGVTSQLSVNNFTLIRSQSDGLFYGANGLAYNPSDELNFGGRFYLTTKDGIAYEIDANTGDLVTLSDANRNVLTFTEAAIESNRGPRITFQRDPQGRITSVTDPSGNRVRYQYDSRGDLISVTDRESNVTQFIYSEPRRPHFLTEIIDPLGRTGVRTEYDAQGRLIRLIDAAGNPVQLIHDPDNSIETVTDALGNSTSFEYDGRGNVVTEIDAAGGATRRTYDSANNMLTERDPLGNVTSFTYDSDGNMLTETDPLGNVTRNTYTTTTPGFFDRIRGARPVALLTTTTDPLGNTTTNTYSGTNLLSTRDAAGNVTSFAYDTAGNQTSITDAAGNVTTFEYDARGNLDLQVDALGNATVFTYDANGNQLSQSTTQTICGIGFLPVCPAGGPSIVRRTLVTSTTYDAQGRPISVTDAVGNTTRTEYDKLGNQIATVDALGRRTTFTYDDRGQLIRNTFADGTTTSTAYDALGRRISSTDRAGRVTRFVYDALGRLTTTIYPDTTPASDTDNPRTRTEYDLAGRVTAQIDELGHRTQFVYDAAGRQTVVRDALGNETTTSYDIAGRTLAATDAQAHTTQFVYDTLGRQIQTRFADGTTTSTAYDALGRSVAQTDQAGRVTMYDYDSLGRLTAVVDALRQRTQYTYDEAGNLLSQRDANGNVTRYEYDGLGRRIATVLPLLQRSTTVYDAIGNVTRTTDFNGDTIVFGYDVVNRLTSKSFPDSTSVQFTYNVTGQRETYIDARGTTRWAYDVRDRLVSRTDPDGRAISYTYDAAGNRTSLTVPSGTTNYTFDELNRTKTVTDPQGGLTRYTYDAGSRLVRTDLPNGTFETRQYDVVNRLLFLENRNPTSVISSYRYTLDATGNRTAVVEDTGRRVDYFYDDLYHLTRESIQDSTAGNRNITYTYDPVGNRLLRTDSVEGNTSYTYDNNDRLLTETLASKVTNYAYDNNGNTLSKADAVDRVLYDWDYENRLIAADTNGDGTHEVTYRYDAEGIRVSSDAGEETRFLIDSIQPYQQVIEEYTPGGVIKVSYVHGLDLISQNRPAETGKSFYHVDGLGSTRALSSALGIVTDRYVYEAFGRTIGPVGSSGNVYLFAGEQRDEATDLDYLRMRWMSPSTGRFYTVDPFDGVFLSPVTLHDYLYAAANPIANIDPGGQFFGNVLATLSVLFSYFDNMKAYQDGLLSQQRRLRREYPDRPTWERVESRYNLDRISDCCDQLGNPFPAANQCAIRMSRALGFAATNGLLCNGFSARAQELATELTTRWGQAEVIAWGNSARDDVLTRKGVVFFQDVSGGIDHIDLWDGSKTKTGEYFIVNGMAKRVWFWEIDSILGNR